MTSCTIGDDGAKAIAAALPGSGVLYLWLNNSAISDEGAQAVAAGLNGSSVAELWYVP
jgi:hypothetical protein